MRIFRHGEFLELPEGVIFARGIRWSFDLLGRKGETIRNDEGTAIDFYYTDLVNIDGGADTGEWADRLEGMLERGESVDMNEDEGRDGTFNEARLYLVYEDADLDRLQSVTGQAKGKLSSLA